MFDPFTARDFQNALKKWDTLRWEEDAATTEHAGESRESGDSHERGE